MVDVQTFMPPSFRLAVSFLLLCSIFGSGSSLAGDGPALEELVECHDQAVGGEVLRAADTVEYELQIEEPTFEVTAVYRARRPETMRIDVFSGEKRVFSEGLEQGVGWQLPGGAEKPVPTSEEGTAALRHGLQRPGHLWTLADMERLGHRLELVDREVLDGTPHTVLQLTLSDGFETWYWIDESTCHIVRSRDFRAFHPDQDPDRVWLETLYDELRRTDGVTRAHRTRNVNLETQEVLATTRLLKVELDPVFEPGALQPPVE